MHLLFVYNAKSGKRNAVADSLHKLLSPGSYQCSLCALTHSVFSQYPKWKRFTRSADIKFTFLHKDEFEQQYRSKWLPRYSFPVILIDSKGQLEIFANNEEINALENTEALINLVKDRRGRYL
jgi:hypothetical protein